RARTGSTSPPRRDGHGGEARRLSTWTKGDSAMANPTHTTNKAGQGMHNMQDAGKGMMDKAKDMASDVADKAKDIAGNIGDKARDLADKAGDRAEHLTHRA